MSVKKSVSDVLNRTVTISALAPLLALTLGSVAFFYFLSDSKQSVFDRQTVLILTATVAAVTIVSLYLDIFKRYSTSPPSKKNDTEDISSILREVRNYLAHPRTTNTQSAQININEDFKGQLIARLTNENQAALKGFIESEVFKKAAENNSKQVLLHKLTDDLDDDVETYKRDMVSWRKNANVNLVIGLACAVGGIAVMWQTLVAISLDTGSDNWRVSDLYHFLARFGLVVIIESVAFFFLKLYREDRSMIRYFRNEITNLESKAAALKTALTFGTPADLSKVLHALAGTERNFLVKKGDRVMSDITYENSEILIEKIFGRPEVLERIAKAIGKGS